MKKLEWTTVRRKAADLVPLDYNPRKITPKKRAELEASLEKFNLVEIPVINTDDRLVAGNQRVMLLVAVGRGDELIDVRMPNRELTEQEIKEYNITSNVHVGIWDVSILEQVFSDIDLEGLGMDKTTLRRLAEVPDMTDDDFDFLSGKAVFCQEGDLFELHSPQGMVHRIQCADSTDEAVVERTLSGAKPVIMVTDPPYGVEYDPTWRAKTNSESMDRKTVKSVVQVKNDDRASWLDAYLLFRGDVAYVWHGGLHCHTVGNDLVAAGFELKGQIIWNKQCGAISRGFYHWKHEPCFYAVRKGKKHNWQGGFDQWTVWDIKNLSAQSVIEAEGQSGHSTQKPLECMLRPIGNNTVEGDGVYDPFLGSGTTLVACEQSGRVCYGQELNPICMDMVLRRWINYLQQRDQSFSIIRNGQRLTEADLQKKL